MAETPKTHLELRDAMVRLRVVGDTVPAGTEGRASRAALPIARISLDPDQPRRNGAVGIDELADSLATHGLLQPIVVSATETGWMVVAGERRLRAARQLGWTVIEAVVLPSSVSRSAVAVVENIQRRQLGREERRAAFLRILSDCDEDKEVAARLLGVSQTTFYRTISDQGAKTYSSVSTRGLLRQLWNSAVGLDAKTRESLAADLRKMAEDLSKE